MPPRKTRAAKNADESQDAPHATQTVEPSATTTSSADVKAQETPTTSTSTSTRSKAKSRAARYQPLLPESAPSEPAAPPSVEAQPEASAESSAPASPSEPTPSTSSKPTMEDRQSRLAALRAKMAASTRANRRDILSEQSRTRTIASELAPASGSRKLAKAAAILEERDLRESGQDVERHRNMAYSLEDSQRWDAKLEEKERRKDSGPGDFGDAAERAYQRQVRSIKPDVARYKKQRDAAEAVKASSPASRALVRKAKASDIGAADELHYGTHKPSDDAIDRVVNHLNHEKQLIQNRSRRRNEDPDAEVNYINDGNRHFNKKLKRFYDKQTQEIRENLERGTAL